MVTPLLGSWDQFLQVLKQPGLVHLALRYPFLPPSCPVATQGGTVLDAQGDSTSVFCLEKIVWLA